MKLQELEKQFNGYKFPYCDRTQEHSSYQLNELCLVEDCPWRMIPQCVKCSYNHHYDEKINEKHHMKPLKEVFSGFLIHLEALQEEHQLWNEANDGAMEMMNDMDLALEKIINKLSVIRKQTKQFRIKYRKAFTHESLDESRARQLLKEICMDQTATTLRNRMKDLSQITSFYDHYLIVSNERLKEYQETVRQEARGLDNLWNPIDQKINSILPRLDDLSNKLGLALEGITATDIYMPSDDESSFIVSTSSLTTADRNRKGQDMILNEQQSDDKLPSNDTLQQSLLLAQSQLLLTMAQQQASHTNKSIKEPSSNNFDNETIRKEKPPQKQEIQLQRSSWMGNSATINANHVNAGQQRLQELERRKTDLKQQMTTHIKNCTCNQCDFLDSSNLIKFWEAGSRKTLTTCPNGRRLNKTMEHLCLQIIENRSLQPEPQRLR